MNPAPPPKSLLGRHRLLSPSASIMVSPLCIGGMSFGEAWKDFMGSVPKKEVFALLDYFYDQGGNFIDTSNNYQAGESERYIGDWLQTRPHLRDEIVLASKYSTSYTSHLSPHERIHSNTAGNGAKSLHTSLRTSLANLRTPYLDLLYVHWYDFSTSIPELMQSLNHLVASGTVLYLGVSDTPAWLVAKANQYARDHGLRQFSVYQGKWSAADRDFERDIIQMCAAEGMGIAPWNALGGGNFKTESQLAAIKEKNPGRNIAPPSAKDRAVTAALEAVAARHGNVPVTSIALAYVAQKAPYVFPVIGGRTVEHLKGNIAALGIALLERDFEEIEGAWEFEVGFPNSFLTGVQGRGVRDGGDLWLMRMAGNFDYVKEGRAIVPEGSG